MEQDRYKDAVAQLLLRFMEENGDDYQSRGQINTPVFTMDMESYKLMVERTGGTGYPRLLTDTIRALKTVVSTEQLNHVITLVKARRSGSNHKPIHTKVGKPEWDWVEQMARSMNCKPIRVLEAVLFLYLRAGETIPTNR
jgi:hypothetical protein